MSADVLRVDKWLWHARVFKTRSLATRFAASGRLRVNGTRVVKASHAVMAGDRLTFALGGQVRVLEVAALGVRRGPAREAAELYRDRSPGHDEPAEAD